MADRARLQAVPADRDTVAAPVSATAAPVDPRQRALQLALDHDRAFTGLRGFAPDKKLFLYIPLSIALREQVVPVVLVGDTLKVAAATLEPDLDVIGSRFPKLTLDLALAPADEIAAALGRAQELR